MSLSEDREDARGRRSKKRSRDNARVEDPGKRAKACIACRRAKLKCHQDEGQPDCERCRTRGEGCDWSQKQHDERWEELVKSDISQLQSQVSHLTSVVENLSKRFTSGDHSKCQISAQGSAVASSSCSRSPGRQPRAASPTLFDQVEPEGIIDMFGPNMGLSTADSYQPHQSTVPLGLRASPFGGTTQSPGSEASWHHPGSNLGNPSLSPFLDMAAVPMIGAASNPSSTQELSIIGIDDPRPNIVKNQMIENAVALRLILLFEQHMTPCLLGYRLKLYHPPLNPAGPADISPFILSVLCMVGATVNAVDLGIYRILEKEVLRLLAESPADNFFAVYTPPADGETRDLDPELGIGCEEIAAAAALAFYMRDIDHASKVSSMALTWIEGYMKELAEPTRMTLAQLCGVLPLRREQDLATVARLYLFCYIIDGLHCMNSRTSRQRRPHPIGAYCNVLIPKGQRTEKDLDDMCLISTAKLVALALEWARQCALHGDHIIASVDVATLASDTNSKLDAWFQSLTDHDSEATCSQALLMIFHHVRLLVNKASLRDTQGHTQQSPDAWSQMTQMSIDAATSLLKKVSSRTVSSLPTVFFAMIHSAAQALVLHCARDESAPLSAQRFAQSMQTIQLVSDTAQIMSDVAVDGGHPCKAVGEAITSMLLAATG